MAQKFDAELHFIAMQTSMGLIIQDPWKPTVLQHLKIAAEMANLINSAPLPEAESALANIYIAGATDTHKSSNKG